MTPRLEPMDEFFTKRIEGYDEHMLGEVQGCAAGYRLMARLAAEAHPRTLLDLGCGTGLELDEIFRLLPGLRVTGIDMTQSMLDRLRSKHPARQLTTILGDYFETELGGPYDIAVSFETLHHFTPERKLELYKRLRASIAEGGEYIECDYMCDTDEQERGFFAELERLKREQGLGSGYYHYDTPLTIEKQKRLLLEAGFKSVEQVFREDNTVMLLCRV